MFGLFDDLLDIVDDQSEFWTGRPLRGGSRPSTHTKRRDPNASLRERVEALERAELERRLKAAERAAARAQEEADAAEIARLMAIQGLEAMIENEAQQGQKEE